MRGSEWIPRGEPEDSGGAVFFMAAFFRPELPEGSSEKERKARKEREFLTEELFPVALLFIFFLLFLSWSSALFRPCARRSIARASRRQLPSMPCLPLELLPARGQRQMLRKFY